MATALPVHPRVVFIDLLWTQAQWETKNLAARFMNSDKLIKGSQSNSTAFANALKLYMETTSGYKPDGQKNPQGSHL